MIKRSEVEGGLLQRKWAWRDRERARLHDRQATSSAVCVTLEDTVIFLLRSELTSLRSAASNEAQGLDLA